MTDPNEKTEIIDMAKILAMNKRRDTPILPRNELPLAKPFTIELPDETRTDRKSERFMGYKTMKDVAEGLIQIFGISPRVNFKIEVLTAGLNREWYLFGPESEYGTCISGSYAIFIENGRRCAKEAESSGRYFRTLGDLVLDSLTPRLAQRGKEIKKQFRTGMVVDTRIIYPE